MIQVEQLCKTYGKRKAIDNLNFTVPSGKIVGFLGPNGAGKTTTMKIITGYMAASTGKILVDGMDVMQNPLEVKSQIGYLPEVPPIYLDMTVVDYLKFVAKLKGVSKDQLSEFVGDALDGTDLKGVSNRRIQNLSKGFKQRVGIAQALVSKPKLLILDEPTVGLDPKQVLEVRELIQSLRGKHTVILSTHVLSEVQATCDEAVIINDGKIVTQSSINDLTKSQGSKVQIKIVTQRLTSQLVSDLNNIQQVEGVNEQSTHLIVTLNGEESLIDNLAKVVLDSGCGLLELVRLKNNLEDVFLKLIDEEESGR